MVGPNPLLIIPKLKKKKKKKKKIRMLHKRGLPTKKGQQSSFSQDYEDMHSFCKQGLNEIGRRRKFMKIIHLRNF